MSKTGYDHDFYAWTQAQAAALRVKAWEELDVDHLAEEDFWPEGVNDGPHGTSPS